MEVLKMTNAIIPRGLREVEEFWSLIQVCTYKLGF
jgi:hypothetical protein